MPQPARPTRREALAVLGLSSTATPAQITTAYRRLAKASHPDRTGETGPAAIDRFTRVTLAYERLAASSPRSPRSPHAHTVDEDPSGQPTAGAMHPTSPRHVSDPLSPRPRTRAQPLLVAGPVFISPNPQVPDTRARRTTL
jgi:DnaJ domain